MVQLEQFFFLISQCWCWYGARLSLALSSILSAIYIASVFYILENQLKNLKIPISILSFVDNGLFIA